MKNKNTFKKIVGKLHLWLGLASGLIVFVVALTGCIFAFSEEITNALRKDVMYVQPETKMLPVSVLWENTQQKIGKDEQLSWVNIYNAPDKSWIFYTFKEDEEAVTYFSHIIYYKAIYVNPYNGQILRIYDEETDFFQVIKMLHWSLLLETRYGQPIVGYGTLAFVVLLLSGLVLWWPKNKAARKQRLAFQWKNTTQWRRKNYDLHNVLGFYVGSLATILAVTGLVWAFQWVQMLVYVVASLSVTPPDFTPAKSVVSRTSTINPLDIAAQMTRTRHATANGFQIRPATPEDTASVIGVYVQQKDGLYYHSHSLEYDRYTGKLLKERRHEDKNFGEKLVTANYDIHVGAILGIWGKILAFVASAICASLPLTGFMIWWARTNKTKK